MEDLRSIKIPQEAGNAGDCFRVYLNVVCSTMDLSYESNRRYYSHQVSCLADILLGGSYKITGIPNSCRALEVMKAQIKQIHDGFYLTKWEKDILSMTLSGTRLDLGDEVRMSKSEINGIIVSYLRAGI